MGVRAGIENPPEGLNRLHQYLPPRGCLGGAMPPLWKRKRVTSHASDDNEPHVSKREGPAQDTPDARDTDDSLTTSSAETSASLEGIGGQLSIAEPVLQLAAKMFGKDLSTVQEEVKKSVVLSESLEGLVRKLAEDRLWMRRQDEIASLKHLAKLTILSMRCQTLVHEFLDIMMHTVEGSPSTYLESRAWAMFNIGAVEEFLMQRRYERTIASWKRNSMGTHVQDDVKAAEVQAEQKSTLVRRLLHKKSKPEKGKQRCTEEREVSNSKRE
jgi:hypothetical protein